MDTSLAADGLAEAMARAAEAGAEGMELSLPTNKAAAELRKKNFAGQLAELRKDHGIDVPSVCLTVLCKRASLIGKPDQVASASKMVAKTLNAAAAADIKTVLVPFFGKNTIETEEELIRAAEALTNLIDPAEQAGVVIAVESTLNFDQQQFLLDHVGLAECIKMCPDTGNALARKLDFATGIRDLGGQAVAQIHFRDASVVEGQPPNFDVALGAGDVDFPAAARAIRAIGYDGWIILASPAGDDPPAWARANLRFAREVMESTQ